MKVLVKDNDIEEVPMTSKVNKNTFAIVIANENYQYVAAVPYAINDGNMMKLYCEKTFGIPISNIHFVKNATLNNIYREVNWLKQVLSAYNGEASVVFYYAGHGIPDETGNTSYLLPVDGIGSDVRTALNLWKLYAELNSQPAQRVMILLDACFCGTNRDGGMLTSTRGVAIKMRPVAPKGNLVVFSAAQGDETAWPYKDKEHGLFTYFLLKKIQETKGSVALGELSDYVCSEVKKQSIIVNGKLQTPIVQSSQSLGNTWRDWNFK